jgi:hypothetical protein
MSFRVQSCTFINDIKLFIRDFKSCTININFNIENLIWINFANFLVTHLGGGVGGAGRVTCTFICVQLTWGGFCVETTMVGHHNDASG